ncbi:hypothetical protein O181_125260 [Austropuccinia psidii MF-1]|uniref:Uncharacterized protein n=1 Tax=Austropuccinia psidii MF-1 TaxID=1389203 RepID=A0A9Q3Q5Y1_9BASI|nr:hypothetical protein [Austropuccinia psidii MF-1]
MTWPIGPNLAPGWIAATIKEEGQTHGCDMNPLMEKKNMMLLTEAWKKNNHPPPKQEPKTAPVARSSHSKVKKKPQDQNKGKGKAPVTTPYSQGYRIPRIQQHAMENVFQMSRTMMELKKKEEARLKYQEFFLTFLMLSQSFMKL